METGLSILIKLIELEHQGHGVCSLSIKILWIGNFIASLCSAIASYPVPRG